MRPANNAHLHACTLPAAGRRSSSVWLSPRLHPRERTEQELDRRSGIILHDMVEPLATRRRSQLEPHLRCRHTHQCLSIEYASEDWSTKITRRSGDPTTHLVAKITDKSIFTGLNTSSRRCLAVAANLVPVAGEPVQVGRSTQCADGHPPFCNHTLGCESVRGLQP
jgi:hypothetical protein